MFDKGKMFGIGKYNPEWPYILSDLTFRLLGERELQALDWGLNSWWSVDCPTRSVS